MKRLLSFLVILLGICSVVSGQHSSTELIVILKSGQSIDQINKNNRTTTIEHVDGTNIYLLQQDGDESQALRKLRNDPSLEAVEVNSGIHLADSEETIFLLDDSEETIFLLDKKTIFNGVEVPEAYAQQPALSIIEADKVRSISTGAATRIATIDTGVDFNHPALRPWLAAGADLVNGTSASEYDGLMLETDADSKTRIPSAFGHGTLVAGLIHLVAPNAVIVPIKAFDPYGRTSLFKVVQAIYQAIELKADAVNMSFSSSEDSPALREAVSAAHAAGVAVVSSMGNDGMQTDVIYPAAYKGAYGVSATDFQDRLAPFSNYGKTVSISAPGANVISTAPGGRYASVSGTSFSAPLVSGTIALLASLQNRGAAKGALVVASAEPIDQKNPGFEKMLGRGRVNARLALEKR